MMEYEHTGNLIRELEEKTRIAENQLKEAQNAHSRTKDEYERLEKILEELNERMEALREESRDRAIRKQQLSGEINVLHEQILAGEQNDSHYRSRLLAVQEDTEKKSAFRISNCSFMASKRCALPLVFARELRISMISFLPSSTAWVHSSMLLWILSIFFCSSASFLSISRKFA